MKRVTYWVELLPGWEQHLAPTPWNVPPGSSPGISKRVAIHVELPTTDELWPPDVVVEGSAEVGTSSVGG